MSRGGKQPELWSVLPADVVADAREAGISDATITAAARKVENAMASWRPPPVETPCSPRWEAEDGDETDDRDAVHVLPVCSGPECPWAAPAQWRNARAYAESGELLGSTGWACVRDGRLSGPPPGDVCWPVMLGAHTSLPGPSDEPQEG